MKEWSELPPGYVIFCDDIREEVGGKTSLIGIYRGSINVHAQFPTVLAKLGVYVLMRWPNPDLIEDIKFAVFLPEDPEDKPTVSFEMKKADVPKGPSEYLEAAFVELNAGVVLSPVGLKSEGKIRVRAYTSKGEIKLGSIKVVSAVAAAT